MPDLYDDGDIDWLAQLVMGHPELEIHPDTRSAVRTVLAALAEQGRLRPTDDRMRVVIVLDHQLGSRYGLPRVWDATTDDAQARRWTRQLIDRHGGNNLAASMHVAVVHRDGQPESRAAADGVDQP